MRFRKVPKYYLKRNFRFYYFVKNGVKYNNLLFKYHKLIIMTNLMFFYLFEKFIIKILNEFKSHFIHI